jgi:MerR family transcriptional regulator, light-induced transcriptional regulator
MDMTQPPSSPTNEPRFRSGAVARMVGMPVTTLRVWERRYHLGHAATTASGHRLYAAADVERLALVKRLTQMGHAIGSIASLDIQTLQRVASTHATTRAQAKASPSTAAHDGPARVVVLGAALASRLQRPRVHQTLGARMDVIATFESLAEVRRRARGLDADLLLVAEASLHEDQARPLANAARSLQGARVAVIYDFMTLPARDAHRREGIELLRGQDDDDALVAWLEGLLGARSRDDEGADGEASSSDAPVAWAESLPVTPRRYDDLTLTDFAGLSTTIACECPRHVAEILMLLSHFEDYSATCSSRDPEDAKLHAYLQRVAGASRAIFEQAVERLAVHEGLVLRG